MDSLYVGWVLPYLSGEEEGCISSSQIKGEGLSETHSESLACAFCTLETGIPLAKRNLQVRGWLELSLPASKEKEGLHFTVTAKMRGLHQGLCGPEEGPGLGCFKREPHKRTPEWEDKRPKGEA